MPPLDNETLYNPLFYFFYLYFEKLITLLVYGQLKKCFISQSIFRTDILDFTTSTVLRLIMVEVLYRQADRRSEKLICKYTWVCRFFFQLNLLLLYSLLFKGENEIYIKTRNISTTLTWTFRVSPILLMLQSFRSLLYYLPSFRNASCVGTSGMVMWCLHLMPPCFVALGRVLIWVVLMQPTADSYLQTHFHLNHILS